MMSIRRVVLVACLFGALKGTAWIVEGHHMLRLATVTKEHGDEPDLKLGEVLMVVVLAISNAASSEALTQAEAEAREQIRNGYLLLGGSLLVAGGLIFLPTRPRPRRGA